MEKKKILTNTGKKKTRRMVKKFNRKKNKKKN